MHVGLDQTTLTTYALVVIPPVDEMHTVELIRRRYDPRFEAIPAHITVVFPFSSALSIDQLGAEIGRTIAAQRAFVVGLDGIRVDDSYVFIDVACGGEHLGALHEGLHEALVDAAASRRHPYRPHMTLGRLPSAEGANEVAAGISLSIEATVASVTICRIGGRSVDQLTSIGLASRARP
jgi:2'-5' RNA ligase